MLEFRLSNCLVIDGYNLNQRYIKLFELQLELQVKFSIPLKTYEL
jgi:hypothetical protein